MDNGNLYLKKRKKICRKKNDAFVLIPRQAMMSLVRSNCGMLYEMSRIVGAGNEKSSENINENL